MSLVNQMLRDLEARGADRSAGSGTGGAPPRGRGMRLVGVLSALVLVLVGAVGYLLWERYLLRPALQASATTAAPAAAGPADGTARRDTQGDATGRAVPARPGPAPAGPDVREAGPATDGARAASGETATGEGAASPPGGTEALAANGGTADAGEAGDDPPSEGHAANTGMPERHAPRGPTSGDSQPENSARSGPSAEPEAPAGPRGGPAATATEGPPETAAGPDPDGGTPAGAAEPPGYALQLGTFSNRAHARRFLAGLPGPVSDEAYIHPVGDYVTVRAGFGAGAGDLKPVRERLAAHGVEALLVHASPPAEGPMADTTAPFRRERNGTHGVRPKGVRQGQRTSTASDTPADPADARIADRPGVAAKAMEKSTAPEAEPTAESRIAKKARPLTPAQQAEQAYRRGRQALVAGANGEAESALREALKRAPGHAEARGALADLLLRRGRQVEAKALLREGLQAAPRASGLRQRLARVRADEGETDRAIRLLEEGLATARDDAGYLALLAALYQRAGRYGESALAYRRALAARPGTAAWLVGLGIALEGAGRPREAGEAYRRAARAGLTPTLQDFVRKRLNGLRKGNER